MKKLQSSFCSYECLIPDPPASSETSVHVVATAMDNMELKCKVEGKKLSIRWYKDKHPLYESGKYHFSDDYRTLTVFRMGNPFDAGKYECVGVNPSGQAVETYHVLFGKNLGPRTLDPLLKILFRCRIY